MKIKIDANLSQAHRRIPEAAGHDVTDVHEEQLAGATDDVLWSRVCEEGRFLVTLDTDFSDVRRFLPGSHPGILLMRTTHPSVSAVSTILRRVLEERDLTSVAGYLVDAYTRPSATTRSWMTMPSSIGVPHSRARLANELRRGVVEHGPHQLGLLGVEDGLELEHAVLGVAAARRTRADR